MEFKDILNDFPIIKNGKTTYLDSAATTQKPLQVINEVTKYYNEFNANPHRGAYSLSIKATEVYEDARKKVAKFINAKNENEIVFTKNATEALNIIAYSYGLNNIRKGDEIVLSIMEHHSNLVPWQMVAKKNNATLKYMYINDNFELTKEEIEKKITDKTKIVAITHVSNVLGTINPIEDIIKIAHKKGAIVVVDATQSVPHMRVDVDKLDVDFLVFSGHKMLSPLGVGVLYAKESILDNMPPFIYGGDMIEYVYEQDTTFAPLPNKFEAGTQNVGGAVGLSSAISYLEDIGFDNIKKIEDELICYAREELLNLDFIELYCTQNSNNHTSVISFNVKGVHPHDVSSILDSQNIAIRSGNHCAQPLMRYLGIDSTCRASIYIYNTKEDIDRLVIGLKKVYDVFKKYIEKGKEKYE